MATTLDPLEQYPAVRQWAEKFYAVKGWAPADAPPTQDGVEPRRVAARLELAKLKIGKEFLPEVRRSFEAGCRTIANAIAEAATLDAMDAADELIKQLVIDVAAQREVAQARAESAQALVAAKARLDAVRAELDEGGFSFTEKALNDARQAHETAGTKPAYDLAKDRLVKFLAVADAARDHGRELQRWLTTTLSFIEQEYTMPVDRPQASLARNAARQAALLQSRQGKFAEATAALAAFPAPPQQDRFKEALKFNAALAAFEANVEAQCDEVIASGLTDASGFKEHAKTARKQGLSQKLYGDGITTLQELQTWCLPRLDLARKFKSFDMAMNKHAEFRNAVAEMQKQQKDGHIDKALDALKSLETDPTLQGLMKENASRLMVKKMEGRKQALAQSGNDSLKKRLEKAWDAHAQAVKDGKFSEAAVLADKLNGLFELETVIPMRAETEEIAATHPDVKAYGYLKDYSEKGLAGKYAEARIEMEAALPQMRQLAVYLDTVAELKAVQAALPTDPPDLRNGLDVVLAQGEIKAKARLPAEGTQLLRAALDGPAYFGITGAIADWKAKDAAVAKRQAQVVKHIADLPALKKTLEERQLEARKPATERGAYAESFMALVQHDKLLIQTQAFAAVRRQVLSIHAGLLRAAKSNPTLLDPSPKTEKDLETAVLAAETKAGEGKVDEASKAFENIRKGCQTLCAAAARHYETADAVGSNAGHSLDRHGPDVTEAELVNRLKTGIPPNAKTPDERSFTGASSKFQSPQDWLAGREISAAAALAQGIDLTATKLIPPFVNQVSSKSFTVEHGKPIDEAYVGRKKNTKFDPVTLELTEDKTYESFEAMTGLTRAFVNWTWEFPELKDVPKEGKPLELENVKARDIKDYVDAYQRKNGNSPAEIPGRWVMMQQFPVAEGWDNELQAYTTDPKDLIP